MLLVGNDVVDLAQARSDPKAGNQRFLSRVFTSEERDLIEADACQEEALWMIWAAKETAYKLACKKAGPVVFSPVKFETRFRARESRGSCLPAGLQVSSAEGVFDVKIEKGGQYIHAVGREAFPSGVPGIELFSGARRLSAEAMTGWREDKVLREGFSAEEWGLLNRAESAWVRYEAKRKISAVTGVHESKIEMIRLTLENRTLPPSVLIDGKSGEWDVSFSHHGSWIGWALAAPAFCRHPACAG